MSSSGARPNGVKAYLQLLSASACVAVLGIEARAFAEPISFEQAIELSSRAPDVATTEQVLASRREGDSKISSQTGSPTVTLQPGVRIYSEEDRGFEGQAQLTHSWNLAGLADARRRSASNERRALAIRVRAAALMQRLEAAQGWFELHTTARALELVRKEVDAAERLAKVISRAVDAGVLERSALSDAEATVAEVEQKALRVEAEWIAAQISLARGMGIARSQTLQAVGPLPEPGLPSMSRLRERLARVAALPEVAAARLEAVAERSREAEVAATNGTQLQAGVQVQRESPNGFMAFGVFSLTFPIADLSARQRSEVKAEALRREGAYRAASREARRLVTHVLHEVEHSRQEERLVKERLLPSLDRLVEELRVKVTAGEDTVYRLLDAERRRKDAELQAVRAEGARRWAEMNAWLLLAAIEAPVAN